MTVNSFFGTRRRGRARGFTLIELLVSIVLMMILMGILTVVFKDAQEIYQLAEARTNIYQNARIAMDKIEEVLLNCYSLREPNQAFGFVDATTEQNPGGTGVAKIIPADGFFFYGRVFVNGVEYKAMLLFRMGHYNKTASHRLLMYVIDVDTKDLIRDTDGTEIEPIELCQYVGSISIQYYYDDDWFRGSVATQEIQPDYVHISPKGEKVSNIYGERSGVDNSKNPDGHDGQRRIPLERSMPNDPVKKFLGADGAKVRPKTVLKKAKVAYVGYRDFTTQTVGVPTRIPPAVRFIMRVTDSKSRMSRIIQRTFYVPSF